MNNELIPGRIYRNYKGNYSLKEVSIDCITRKEYAIIQALYPDYGVYHRTKSNFFEAGFQKQRHIYQKN